MFSVNALEPVAVLGVVAIGQLAHEVERDDALAGSGAALDEDDRLLRIVVAGASLGQDRLEGDPLLVEEHELAGGHDHGRGVLEELAAGAVLGLEDASHDRGWPSPWLRWMSR